MCMWRDTSSGRDYPCVCVVNTSGDQDFSCVCGVTFPLRCDRTWALVFVQPYLSVSPM